MTTYTRISFTEREEISRGLAANEKVREIARHLGRDAGTVSREVNSAGMRAATYRAEKGQRRADSQAATSRRAPEVGVERGAAGVRVRRPPQEMVAPGDRATPEKGVPFGHGHASKPRDHLYAPLLPSRGELKKELLSYLRRDEKLRGNRKSGKDRRGQIPDMLSIEERPAEVADQTVPGNWEGDLILGKGSASAMGTLVERTTRFLLLVPLEARDAVSVR